MASRLEFLAEGHGEAERSLTVVGGGGEVAGAGVLDFGEEGVAALDVLILTGFPDDDDADEDNGDHEDGGEGDLGGVGHALAGDHLGASGDQGGRGGSGSPGGSGRNGGGRGPCAGGAAGGGVAPVSLMFPGAEAGWAGVAGAAGGAGVTGAGGTAAAGGRGRGGRHGGGSGRGSPERLVGLRPAGRLVRRQVAIRVRPVLPAPRRWPGRRCGRWVVGPGAVRGVEERCRWQLPREPGPGPGPRAEDLRVRRAPGSPEWRGWREWSRRRERPAWAASVVPGPDPPEFRDSVGRS